MANKKNKDIHPEVIRGKFAIYTALIGGLFCLAGIFFKNYLEKIPTPDSPSTIVAPPAIDKDDTIIPSIIPPINPASIDQQLLQFLAKINDTALSEDQRQDVFLENEALYAQYFHDDAAILLNAVLIDFHTLGTRLYTRRIDVNLLEFETELKNDKIIHLLIQDAQVHKNVAVSK